MSHSSFSKTARGRLRVVPWYPHARGLETPAHGVLLDVVAVAPGLTPEEGVPYVGHLPLDEGLARRHPRRSRIDREPPVRCVLLEGAREGGVVAIGLGDGCLQVVDDEAVSDAPKEGPGVFEPADEAGDRLLVRDEDELVAAEDEHDDQRPQHPALAAQGIRHEAETAEVHLGHLARRGLGHPHRHALAFTEATVVGGEAVQRAVGDHDALTLE